MSFIKLDQELYGSRFFVVREEDCGTGTGAIIETRENGRWGATIYVFKSEEEAGEYAREFWREQIEDDPAEALSHFAMKVSALPFDQAISLQPFLTMA